MILSNVEIQRALDAGEIIINPEPLPRKPQADDLKCPYQTSSVDLRLSPEVLVFKEKKLPTQIDLSSGGFAQFAASACDIVVLTNNQPFALEPNHFILGRTLERIVLPLHTEADRSIAARVEGRSSYARAGLLVHFTAPTIHAGYEGTITLEIMNLGHYKISLVPEMPICQLVFEQVLGRPFRNDSQFQGQRRPGGHA